MKHRMTKVQWLALGKQLFGPDPMKWRFVCPVCGHVATVADWKASGAGDGAVAFSCIGRWIDGSKEAFVNRGQGPCTYAGGGLFRLNPIEVLDEQGKVHEMFDFDRSPAVERTTG